MTTPSSHPRRYARTSEARIVVITLALIVIAASTAQAQVARFRHITDAVPGKYFDATTSVASTFNPNKLKIGFNSGLDPLTFEPAEFVAFGNRIATDTIAFDVKAPTGYYVSKITYSQFGSGSTLRTSVEMGSATWVVAGHAASLGDFRSDPGLSGTADVAALRLQVVPVSITLSLAASTGSITVTSANVFVQVAPF
jgi:hypothetical protein